jgi:transaldolase
MTMPIFLDTADLKEIKRFHRMGIIRGVTTNPTILLKQGVTGGMRGIEAHSKEIASLIAPLPVSVEVTSNDFEEVMNQAQTFASWADNIVVKVTIHGPEGELENMEIIHDLETNRDIRVNVTAMMRWPARLTFRSSAGGSTTWAITPAARSLNCESCSINST